MSRLRPFPTRASLFAGFAAAWITVVLASVQTSARQAPSAPAPASAAVPTTRAMLDRYCAGCHSPAVRSGGLALDGLDAARPELNADVWERVIRKLRAGSMPPAGRPRPDAATYHAVASRLETDIDRAASSSPNPGRSSTVHRLNRTEYGNAIRDLLALDIDTASLPSDDTSDTGFDNNGDVLSIATAQLERYLSVARRITRLATGLAPPGPVVESFDVANLLVQDDRQSEDLPLGSRGGIAIRYYFPVDGEYLVKVRLQGNYQDYIFGMGTPQQLDIRIDGALQKRLTVGGATRARPAPASFTGVDFGDPEWERYVREGDDHLEVRVPVKAGPRQVAVSFVRNIREPEGILQPRQGGSVLSNDELFMTGNARVGTVSIGGPYRIDGPGDTPSRREIFVCQPQAGVDDESCATTILSRLARRAYRRPVTARDIQTLLAFYRSGRSARGSFEAGIQLALERLLADPDFLLRIQRDPPRAAAGRPYRLSDLDVASRLSFFLWSSIPDDQLLDLAERGTLTTPPVLEQQVRRMLADARAGTLVDNFGAQWLHLRSLSDVVGDPLVFPDFDQNLVDAFQKETELFFASTVREDRSVLDLLGADYTFVNERLARHYGIPGIYGNRFRRVTLPNLQQRGGLLGHGGLLALTSYPTRTSPVLRGKWLLDTILGAPPPPPPPDVPDLPERGEGGRAVSVRQRLEQHRSSPTCASCHAAIDPLGFALENFDGLGAWRTVDEAGRPVDATGVMPGGEKVEGLAGLRALLLSQREQFVGTVTEKLLAYALGRGLEYYDQPTVRKIVRDAAAEEHRWSALILGVVKSPAFLMRTSRTAE
jgi:mono/diheme cytochrome c family protein